MRNVRFSKKIQAELVQLLYGQIKFALYAESLAAISLFWVMWGAVNNVLLTSWLVLLLLFSSFGRHVLVYFYNKADNANPNKASMWLNLFMLGAFFSGIFWGVAGSLLMPQDDMVRQTFIVFLLIGVTAAANTFYSPNPKIYAAFLLPAFVPFTVWLILQGDIYPILGLMALIYMIIMFATSYYSHKLISNSLYLQFVNTDLLDDLSQAMNELEKRSTQKLARSLSLVRATLESTTDGILVVDSENKIEDFNQKFVKMWKIPAHNLQNQNIKTLIDYVTDKLIDPITFTKKFDDVSLRPELESFEEIYFKDGRVFECYSHPQRLGDKFVGHVWSFRNITERKSLEKALFKKANYDSLTELPNRSLLLDRITQSIIYANRTRLLLAVLYIDLDRFKLINDTFGHGTGDKLLVGVSERLSKCVRENDTVSREGGDEYLIILNYLKSENDSIPIIQKILESIREPFIIDHHKFSISLSIGVSFYPKDGQYPDVLIKNADIAMYRAKELGRNNFQFFTEEMNKKVFTRAMLENQLRDALSKDQFNVVYQPIINLASGNIVGLEALLRWNHPKLGMVHPQIFIPIAEETGMIIPIGDWTLRTACSELKKWQDNGFEDLQVAVNLSAVQFKQTNFFDKLKIILNDTGLSPKSLQLELTESIIMEDVSKTNQVLQKMKKMGMLIVIDDFGIGYSSLSYLKQFPVNKLKIDRSFITDIPHHADDAAITSAIIALANQLQLKVVAEGVESQEQVIFLNEHKCDEIQGFYISPPLEVEACTKLLNDNKNSPFTLH